MNITYENASVADIEIVYELCESLIMNYEDFNSINVEKVLAWVRRKLTASIGEYTVIRADGEKSGYYHFFRNDDGEYEIDDLYVFPGFRGMGIGTEAVRRCCTSVYEPVMLYVFIRNERAVALYKRLGFEISETLGESRYIMRRIPSAQSL